MSYTGAYILGGIESRDINRLAEALLAEALAANSEPPVEARSRHVNTTELRRIAERVLAVTSSRTTGAMSHETPVSLKRKDTPEAREYWEFVEKVAAQVRTHYLCFTTMCVLQDENCPKRLTASPPAADPGLWELEQEIRAAVTYAPRKSTGAKYLEWADRLAAIRSRVSGQPVERPR